LALGSFSAVLARQIGVHLDVHPAKGYSITVPIADDTHAFNISLTDDEYKLVYSRLGDQMRIPGTAELNGYSMALNQTRCEAIVNPEKSTTAQNYRIFCARARRFGGAAARRREVSETVSTVARPLKATGGRSGNSAIRRRSPPIALT
jgi:glycine/D-amino acid oxidase-like deaminating enzyme